MPRAHINRLQRVHRHVWPQQRLIPLCCTRIADEVASGSGMDAEAPDQADRTLTWFQTILHHTVKFAYACTRPSRCIWGRRS